MTEEHVFFVHLEGAHQLRRNILGAARGVLTSLRRVETVQAIRSEKISCILQLKKKLDELQTLGRKLRTLLPKTSIKPEIPRHVQTPVITQVQHASPRSKLELLEEELAKVERTLTTIE